MSLPISTPFPVPEFEESENNNKFFDFLDEIINDQLAPGRVHKDAESWIRIIDGLSDHFLAPLRFHHGATWSALHEKAQLASRNVEIVQRATVCVQSLVAGPGDFTQNMFVRLLTLCSSLDSWEDAFVDEEENVPSPSDLKAKALEAAVTVLRRIDATPPKSSEEPHWIYLRKILEECLDTCHGMLT
jgi:hypothetical protein